MPVYMLFIRGGGSGGTSNKDLINAARDPSQAAKVLTQEVGDPGQGITVHFPSDWSGTEGQRVIRVVSGDKTTAIAITSRGGARDAKTVFEEALAGITSSYKPSARVRGIPSKQQAPIAGLPSAGAAVTAELKQGAVRTAQLFVARGRHRSYVITVLAPPGIHQQPLGVAYLILGRGLMLSD